MKVLLIEDDRVDELALKRALRDSELDVTVEQAADLSSARRLLATHDYHCALLDLRLPDGDGLGLLDEAKGQSKPWPPFIVLTGVQDTSTALAAMRRGAEDYLLKDEVDARAIQRAIRYAIERNRLTRALEARVAELEEMVERVRTLEDLLPICSYCKSIRDNDNYWLSVEDYLLQHSEARLSHGICPDCYEEHVEPQLESLDRPRARIATPRDE